ncbi:MAG: COR domain-containing protein, partial [Bacteroidota bacterium]
GDNPISAPPIEIVDQGRDAILDWFDANKVELNEIKMILIGDPKAGKTSLLRRLKDGTFNPDEPQTDGINIEDIEFSQCDSFYSQTKLHNITAHFWDFGGQEIMNSTHQFFLTNRSIYILLLNARNDIQVSDQIRTWVQRIKATGGNSPIVVVANQVDINPGFGFDNEYDLQAEFPQIKAFIPISCATGENLEVLKDTLEEWVPQTEMFQTEIDQKWIPVKNQLQREVSGGNERYMDESRFLKICQDNGLDQERKQLSLIRFLHDLGLVLHFDGKYQELSEYFVLDPYWITYGVYQILTSKLAGKQKGIVRTGQLKYIINEEEEKLDSYKTDYYEKINYSPNQRRFLVDILHEFKLCFYLKNSTHFIIPDLLDTNEPLLVTKPIRETDHALRFGYEYEYLPTSVMPEFMVETHGMLKYIWRHGCVLEYDNKTALVRSTTQNRILITIVGEKSKRSDFLSIVRYIIENISRGLAEQPMKIVPLPGFDGYYAEYDDLIELKQGGETKYSHRISKKRELFDITELLGGIPSLESQKLIQMIEQVLSNQENMKSGIETLLDSFDSFYKKLNTRWKEDFEKVLDEINEEQIEQIKNELLKALGTAFEVHNHDISQEFRQLHHDLTTGSNTQLKLKIGFPLLVQMISGLQVEAEFDLKNWATTMYEKYKLEVFKFIGAVSS